MHYRRTAPHPGPLPIGWGEGEWLVAARCSATRGLSSKPTSAAGQAWIDEHLGKKGAQTWNGRP